MKHTNIGVAILGAHRSGTSALAGSLRNAGLYLGNVLEQKFELNPTGLQEPASLLYMHENLLEANGGSWDQPPKNIEWGKMHKAVRDLFIESRSGVGVWGFKDPRTLLVLDGWLEALPELKCAGIFRHPLEVAESLARRNGFSIEKGFAIWDQYNERLLELAGSKQMPLIEFVGDEAEMARSYSWIAERLNLDFNAEHSIYEQAHHHLRAATANLPAKSLQVYQELQKVKGH